MKVAVFPGQGAQFVGMANTLREHGTRADELLAQADEVLGFPLSDTMTTGSEAELQQTRVTQPAIYVHSVVRAMLAADRLSPTAVAGHSLGEFSALAAVGALDFADGLRLVARRAEAMQAAGEANPGTMAAILGLDDSAVAEICDGVAGVVVAANYNCPGQLVISGEVDAVERAMAACTEAGAKRAIGLNVGGAFHSPLMEPARAELEAAIADTELRSPRAKIYQNVDALPHTDVDIIRRNLIAQLTAPVRWAASVERMIADGATDFVEVGGKGGVLRGLIRKIDRHAVVETLA